jgi:hypothetical protein
MSTRAQRTRRVLALQEQLHRVEHWKLLDLQRRVAELDTQRRELIAALNDSYTLFQPGEMAASGDVAALFTRTTATAFRIGVQLARTADDPEGRAFQGEKARLPADVPVTLIFNKIDLAAGLPVADTISGPPRVHVSATTGAGLDLLRAHLKDSVSFQTAGNGSDFPVPVLGHRMWLQRWIDTKTFRATQKIANPLERDWQFKRALGFSETLLTRASSVLRLNKEVG